MKGEKKNVSQVSYSAILIYRHNSEKNLKIKIKTPLNLYELLIGRSLATGSRGDVFDVRTSKPVENL